MPIKKEIIINADVKKVWKIFCELERWNHFGGYILKTKWLSKTKWKKGSIFMQQTKGFFVFKQLNSKAKVTDVKPYKYITWEGTRKFIKGTHTLKFQKLGSNTKVSNIEYFTGPLAPIIFPLIKNKFNIYFEQFLTGLKKVAEK